MIKRSDRRGSHVGVVISFAIFVTFIIFLYVLIQPIFKEDKKEEAFVSYLEKALVENVSSELTVITAKLETPSAGTCVSLDGLVSRFGIDNHIYVWNDEQLSTPAGVLMDNVRINRLNTNDDFFKIHYSSLFKSSESGIGWGCQNMVEGTDYILGVTEKKDYVFESLVLKLMNNYNYRYEEIKNELNIPSSYEFGFGIVHSDGSTIETHVKDVSKNIYIKEIPIEYVSLVGKVEEGKIKIEVW